LTQLVLDKIWKYSAKFVKFFGVSPMDTNLDPHPLFGSKMDVNYIFDRADTIEFDRFFVDANEAKFHHGMNMDDC